MNVSSALDAPDIRSPRVSAAPDRGRQWLAREARTTREGAFVLTIRRLQTGYGKVQILRGIDMVVPDGKIVAFLGGNGTGKSTLLKAVSGLLPV